MISRIGFKNLGPYRGEHDAVLPGPGLYLVEGENLYDGWADSNGSGKSFLASVIPFTFWGSGDRGALRDEVITQGETECSSFIQGAIGTRQYQVTRARTVGKQGDKLTFVLDGKDLTRDTVSDTEAEIAAAFSLDEKTMRAAAFFDASFEGLDVREALDRLWDFVRFDRARASADKKLKALESDLVTLASARSEAGVKLRSCSAQLQNGLNASGDTSQQQAAFKAAMQQAEAAGTAAKTKRDESFQKSEQQRAALEKINAGIQQLQDQAGKLTAQRNAEMALTNEMRGQRNTLAHLMEQSQQKGHCALCGSQQLGNMGPMITMIDQAIQQKEQGVNQLQTQLNTLSEQLNRLAAGAQTATANGNALLLESQAADREYQHQRDAYTRARDALAELTKEGQQESQKLIPVVQAMKVTMRNAFTAEVYGQAKSADVAILSFLASPKGFGNQGLKNYLQDAKCPEFNSKLSVWTGHMSDGDLPVALESQSTKGSGISRLQLGTDSRRGTSNIKTRSGGEKRRMSLSIIFAMAEYAKSLGVLVLDEVLERIDQTGCQRLIRMASTQLKDRQIFIIPHHSALKGLLEPVAHRILVVRGEDGNSKIAAIEGLS